AGASAPPARRVLCAPLEPRPVSVQFRSDRLPDKMTQCESGSAPAVVLAAAALLLVMANAPPAHAIGLKMPSYITACKKNDPNLNECVVKAGRNAIPHFINGKSCDRKYKIPNLNPLTVYDFKVSQGTRSVGLKIHMKEATVLGLPELVFESAKVDLKKRHIEWNLKGETISITGIYNVTGNVLILPITGQGPANITLKNCAFNYTFDYDLKKQSDGKDYMKITNSNLKREHESVYQRKLARGNSRNRPYNRWRRCRGVPPNFDEYFRSRTVGVRLRLE
ncbi:hypothetical protein FOCC_FOCC014056, partial [Frankliniella occidentalis]